MQKQSDETLVAYLDGELDSAEQHDVEAWLDADPSVRERLVTLARSTELVHKAFADIVNEPVPERLIAAARGTNEAAEPHEAEILVLKRPVRAVMAAPVMRWGGGLAVAAGLLGLILGGAGSYFASGIFNPANPAAERQLAAAATNNTWLDNAAGYYKLVVNAGDSPYTRTLVDMHQEGDRVIVEDLVL